MIAAGALAAGIALEPPHQEDLALLAIVATLCAAAGLYEVFAPGHYSFQPNLAFFFWGVVLLPHWAVAPLAVACFLPGLFIHRERWYLAAFNAGTEVAPEGDTTVVDETRARWSRARWSRARWSMSFTK